MENKATQHKKMLASTKGLNESIEKWKISPDAETLTSIQNHFDTLLLLSSNGVGTSQILLDNFPLLVTAHKEFDEYFSVTRTRTMLTLLNKSNNLEALLKIPGADEALAWYCCDHSCLYIDGNNEIEQMKMFRKLIGQWTEQEVPESIHPDLPFVIKTLYGETCWELYKMPLNPEEEPEPIWDMINEVNSLGLPLVFKKNNTGLNEVSVVTPDSMI